VKAKQLFCECGDDMEKKDKDSGRRRKPKVLSGILEA